jgi:hypothetical protein
MTLEEVTEIDHQRVLAVLPTKMRGRQSGAATEQRLASRHGRERWSALSSTGRPRRPSKPPGCRSSALDEKRRFAWKAAVD